MSISFGVRAYRESVSGGMVRFGRALAVGLLIGPVTTEEIARKKAAMDRFAAMYSNPAVNAAMTFAEPLPVALFIALVSAGVLSRRKTRLAGDVIATAQASAAH